MEDIKTIFFDTGLNEWQNQEGFLLDEEEVTRVLKQSWLKRLEPDTITKVPLAAWISPMKLTGVPKLPSHPVYKESLEIDANKELKELFERTFGVQPGYHFSTSPHLFYYPLEGGTWTTLSLLEFAQEHAVPTGAINIYENNLSMKWNRVITESSIN